MSMAEIKEVLSGVLVKALNLTEAEVSALYDADGNLKDDAQDIINSKHSDVVGKAKALAKQDRDAAFARGIKEKAKDLAAVLTEAVIEVGEAEGEELALKIKDQIAAKAKPSDLEDDKVKAHPLYLKVEKEANAKLAAKEKEWTEKWATRDTQDQRDRTLSKVKQRAEELKSVLKPVLPEDEKLAKNQLRLLELDINAVDYDTDEDGEILIKGKDGKRLEKANGHPMSLDEYLEGAIRGNFPIQVSENKGSAGDITKGTEKKGALALVKPATREEYTKMVYAINEDTTMSPKDKVEHLAQLRTVAGEVAA